MGGDGSGRKVGTEKRILEMLGTKEPQQSSDSFNIPNYSGIKDSVRKDFPSGWTAGSVVFIGSTGDFTQDNANLFWDNTNNRLGIGTTSPLNLLSVNGTGTAVGGFTGAFEVVGNFRATNAGAHSAISVDALTNQDAIYYLAENGNAVWDMR